MKITKQLKRVLCISLMSFCMATFAQEAPIKKIELLQSVPLSGLLGGVGKAYSEGAKAYFEYLNKEGNGINGAQVRLEVLDDEGKKELLVAHVKKAIREGKPVFGLLGSSTPAVALIDGGLGQSQSLLLGAMSGQAGEFLNYNNAFNSRASIYDELFVMMEHIENSGLKRVSLVYENDSFGQIALEEFNKLRIKFRIEGTGVAVEKDSLNVEDASKILVDTKPDVVISLLPYTSASLLIKKIKESASPQFFLASSVYIDEFARVMKGETHGVVFAQAVPYFENKTLPLVLEYRRAMSVYAAQTPLSFASFEGFILAKITAETMKRSQSGSVTRGSLEEVTSVDLGGLVIGWKKMRERSTNSPFVELMIFGKNDKILY